MPQNKYLQRLTALLSGLKLTVLAVMYVTAYLAVELLIKDPIRHYNFCVFLSLSGIFFSWLIGGRRTMFYVAFFNMFFVFIFSKLLWDQGIIIYKGLFVAKSFLTMYVLALVLLVLMLLRKSPADRRMQKQKKAIERARQHRQNLELMVASRKLKQDLIAQANMVKDELQLLEGAWQSKIHDIINDLPSVKERELYRQILLPFQENIIKHLRDLELSLTFDLEEISLAELGAFLIPKIKSTMQIGAYKDSIEIQDAEWHDNSNLVLVDKNKVWDMVLNVLRNSQAALDLKRIALLSAGATNNFQPRMYVALCVDGLKALIKVFDNGGGVSPEQADRLYREPVPSRKRGGKSQGQGTLFVKFFAERMGIRVGAHNTDELDDSGLAVVMRMPLHAVKSAE